jgi:hypothetical protein
MLQPNIPITIPKQPKTSAGREETESIALGGEEVVQIVRALFGVSSKGKTWSSDVERVYESVCPAFSVIWTKLRRDLVWPQGSGASIEPLACKVASDK